MYLYGGPEDSFPIKPQQITNVYTRFYVLVCEQARVAYI